MMQWELIISLYLLPLHPSTVCQKGHGNSLVRSLNIQSSCLLPTSCVDWRVHDDCGHHMARLGRGVEVVAVEQLVRNKFYPFHLFLHVSFPPFPKFRRCGDEVVQFGVLSISVVCVSLWPQIGFV